MPRGLLAAEYREAAVAFSRAAHDLMPSAATMIERYAIGLELKIRRSERPAAMTFLG